MSRTELSGLAPLRRHREAQAERDWLAARADLQAREQAVSDAQAELARACGWQAERRRALAQANEGRPLGLLALNAWAQEEQQLLAEVARQRTALQGLRQAVAEQAALTETAQRQLRDRRRALEKLNLLASLFTEEPSHD